MKKICLSVMYVLLVITVIAQNKPQQDSILKAHQKKIKMDDKEERKKNIYANRKYSFSISLNPYANISKNSNSSFYKSFDVSFSDRIEWLDVGKNGSLETTFGIGFEPYQGTKLNTGWDYELLSKKHKANIYVGFQYSLGLAQLTSLNNDNSFVNLGFHNYLMPFIGVMWWPGKEDITSTDLNKKYLYQNPKFWQLFYVKLHVGYSYLLNKLQLDTTGIFGNHMYENIRNNTSNTLNFKVSVGINIPTFGEKRRRYINFLESKRLMVE